MIHIKSYKAELEKIIQLINISHDIDATIFDSQSRIIACTKDYLLHKGKTVHVPSIEEVIAKKSVVVNKPGHMPTCTGCRFTGNCPAKIEILKSIQINDILFGVMAFTSFSKEGHDKITQNLKLFIDALNTFSDWIARLLYQKQISGRFDRIRGILNAFMDLSKESVLVINPKGVVIECNTRAQKLFSHCDLYTMSAYHILPDHIVDKILEGNHLKETGLIINNRQARVSAKPIFENNALSACVLSIHETGADIATPKSIKAISNNSLSTILGNSPRMLKIKKTVIKLSRSLSTILITGETGTGKGMLARVIHQTSIRSKGPFITLNCTSIPETLFESELFGYEEGAFTGAKKGGKPGRMELAQQGTLFLDEVGEMPLHMQVKLLNVLQDYEFQRVGGVAPISINVRIIAATNQDLNRLVKEKKFRADLFYRLNVIPITLPPLNIRGKDIEIIARVFLQDAAKKSGKNIKKISGQVMDILRSHTWPGNIRELQNIIEYCINIEEGDTITADSLPERFSTIAPRSRINLPKMLQLETRELEAGELKAESGAASRPDHNFKSQRIHFDAQTILSYLDLYGYGVQGKKKAAEKLGISLRTLYRKLEKHRQTS